MSKCKHIDVCPSASGWCNNAELSADCIPFLQQAVENAKERKTQGMTFKTNAFTIYAQLPSLNEYTNKCRTHWATGAKMKENIETIISLYIKQGKNTGKCRPIEKPCEISIIWHEKTKRRDVDNIQSAQKFILDAMQKCGLIPNDSRRWVQQIHHTITDSSIDKVEVIIQERS